MTDPLDFTPVAERWQKIFDYNSRFSKMSLEEKIDELKKLGARKNELKEEIGDLGYQITVLENIPDVAEYRTVRDKVSMNLLEEFGKNEGISYRDFINGIDTKKDHSYVAIVLNRMVWLRRAELIDFGDGRWFPNDNDVIKLTERGKTVQYIGEK